MGEGKRRCRWMGGEGGQEPGLQDPAYQCVVTESRGRVMATDVRVMTREGKAMTTMEMGIEKLVKLSFELVGKSRAGIVNRATVAKPSITKIKHVTTPNS